jgi:hypothetical protein
MPCTEAEAFGADLPAVARRSKLFNRHFALLALIHIGVILYMGYHW